MTTAREIGKWEKCKQLASEIGVTITLNEYFVLTHKKLNLGVLYSVDEVYGFLCGYEHGRDK